MWQEIFNVAISNGIFAVLFVLLLFYQLKDSAKRELKYQKTIESLSIHLNKINDVDDKVALIKDQVILRGKKSEIKRQDQNI